MLKFGNSANPAVLTVREIETIAKLGMDFAEIVIEPPFASAEMLVKNADAIKAALEKCNLFAYGHAPWYIMLGSSHIIERASGIVEVQKAIEAAATAGMQKLVVHTGSADFAMLSPSQKKKFTNMMAMSFDFLKEYGEKKGVQVLAENTNETAEEFLGFLRKTNGAKATLDIGHAFIRGGMNEVKNFIAELGDRLEHVHLHDNNGAGDAHLALGSGKINIKEVVKALKMQKYDKTITLEIFSGGRESGVRESARIFRELWKAA